MCSISTVYGQTIKELEYDLSSSYDFEKYGEKIDKAYKLLEIDTFNYQAIKYICRYYYDRKIDSVSIFFDNLAAKYPNKPEPHILRSKLFAFEYGYDYGGMDEYNKLTINHLKLALDIDKTNKITLFDLAKTYYRDFIFPLEKNIDLGFKIKHSQLFNKKNELKKSTFEHAADSALVYLYALWNIDEEQKDVIYFPIRQLECYLNIKDKSPIPEISENNFENCYFPSWYFANLKNDWECNYTIDYLFNIASSKSTGKWLQLQLSDLDEHCLYKLELGTNEIIYRFTWLRSFHNPISIRVEKRNDNIMLYWKIGEGAGAYQPQGIKKSEKKEIPIKAWNKFVNLINKAKFESLPNESNTFLVTDGARWTMERKTSTNFKVHNNKIPNDKFQAACLYLLKLTDIEVKENDIY
jgi:hypothetical protein